MKKTVIALLTIAAAAAVACQDKEVEVIGSENLVPLTIIAEQSGTRTHIEQAEGGWQPYWNDQDSIFVTLGTDLSKAFTFTNTSGEGTTASFSGSIQAADGELTIYAFSPKKAARSEAIFKFDIAPEQELPSLTTFDPRYDLLISDAASVTVADGKATASDKLHFNRITAVTRVVVGDATSDGKLSGLKITNIKLTSATAVLTGRLRVDVTSATVDAWEKDVQYGYVSASYDGDDWSADGSSSAYVITGPATIPAGSSVSLEVTFDDGSTVTHSTSAPAAIELATGIVNTLIFNIVDADFETVEGMIWDFSTTEWQNALQAAAPGAKDSNQSGWSVSLNGLTYTSGSKNGKWSTDYIQPNGAGSTTERVFTFVAPEDGTLIVTASTPTKDAVRNVCVTGCASQQVPTDGSKGQLSFSVKKGTVNVYPDAGIRFFVLEYKAGSDPGEDPDDPDEPAEAAELECTNPPATGTVDPTALYGFAEAAGVTGGEGASATNILHFNSGKALQTWLLARAKSEKKGDSSPVIIWLSGTFGPDDGRDFSEAHPWFDVKEVSNLSFFGTDDFVMDRIGFFCVRSSNIIIRNINFQQPKANNGADAVSMQDCDGVWVDHCTFTSLNQVKDYEDGSTDITHGSKNVTVSWCRYIKTQKSCLVGHSNNQSSDTQITATFHHNWFDGSSSRHPRVRFGTAHVYNNLFDAAVCKEYGPVNRKIYIAVNGERKLTDEFKIDVKANVAEDFTNVDLATAPCS